MLNNKDDMSVLIKYIFGTGFASNRGNELFFAAKKK
jgi:hypothetical protein